MRTRKKLHIGMSLAPTWLSDDAWRRPDSEIEGIYGSDFYVDIARRAEAAKLDFVFRPDTLFLDTSTVENGPGFSSLDPTLLLAAIARDTSRIGLLSTVSTTFLPPYVVARQIQSLNWLSNGRAGWNIVTALDGNENFGLSVMPSAQERYARAKEFTEVVRQLWASYPADALEIERDSGRYADATRIRSIDHHGAHFRVKGPLNLPAWGEARIPLVQAGASPEGRAFAASIADAIFASTPDKEAAIDLRRDLRQRAERHGRTADDILLLPGLSLYLAESRQEARDLFAATHRRVQDLSKIASIQRMVGLDLTQWPPDRRITPADLPSPSGQVRSRTHSELLRRLIEREQPTRADLLSRPEVVASAHWQIIGTVGDALEQIKDWADSGAIDGFVTLPGGSVNSMRLALQDLTAGLVDAGLFRAEYTGATFMSHLQDDRTQ